MTGLVVSGKVNVPRSFMKNLRAAVYQLEKGGADPAEIHRARGRIAYAAMVRGKDDPAVRRLMRRLRRVMYIYKHSTQACSNSR